jgi:DNA-binding transcriptional regulator YiaG
MNCLNVDIRLTKKLQSERLDNALTDDDSFGMDITELLSMALAREHSASGCAAHQLRIRHGLSVRDIAEAAGVTPAVVWRWDRGQPVPRTAPAARYGAVLTEFARLKVRTPA